MADYSAMSDRKLDAAVEATEGHDKHWEALEADHPPLSEPVRSQLIRHTRALGSDANKEK